MKKWVKIHIEYDDGSFDVWTPETLERAKFVAKELVEMLLRSAVKKEAKA